MKKLGSVDRAWWAGSVVVASAGNGGTYGDEAIARRDEDFHLSGRPGT